MSIQVWSHLCVAGIIASSSALGSPSTSQPTDAPPSDTTFDVFPEKDIASLTKDKLTTRDGTTLVYHAWEQENEKGAIVFVAGMGETYVKYGKIISTFIRDGYSVYAFDLRGQGFSQHQKQFPDVAHVRNFGEYTSDLGEFISKVVNKKSHEHLFYAAHSLAGHVGILYSMEHPNQFKAMALSGPMVEFQTQGIPRTLGYAAVSALVAAGQGARATVSKIQCYKENPDESICSQNTEAKSQWAEFQKNHPGIALDTTSNSWTKSGIESGWRVLRNASKLTVPTIMFQATEERFVMNKSQVSVCSKAQKCKISVMKGSLHEIFFERADIQSNAIAQTLQWFDENK